MEGAGQFRVSDVINATRISSIQIQVFALCFLTVGIDGLDTSVMGFLAPAIAREWDVAPQSLSFVFGAGMLGSVVGSAILGPIADAFGRARTMLCASATFGVLTVWASGANDLTTLTVLRFCAGIGLGGVLPCAIALTSEYSPDQRRSSLVTAMFCGFTLGAASGGFVAAWMLPAHGWRAVLIAGGITPLVIVLLGWVALPESLSYLVSKSLRLGEVRKTLARIAPNMSAAEWTLVPEPALGRSPARELFAARPAAGTLLLWAVAFMGLTVVYLLSNWMPLLLTNQGYTLGQASLITAMFQVGGTTGAILIGLMMDRYKPNRVIATASLLAAGFVIAIGSLAHVPAAEAMAIFCAGFCIPGAQVGASAYAAAWYPTRVRATGISWMSGMGRVGSILGSVSGGGLLAMGFGMPAILALLAIPMTIGAIAMALHERVGLES
jgi:AAHS family 4-hydroxybenzoate transporter-like MFS transporter